jgi:hypothetical protein
VIFLSNFIPECFRDNITLAELLNSDVLRTNKNTSRDCPHINRLTVLVPSNATNLDKGHNDKDNDGKKSGGGKSSSKTDDDEKNIGDILKGDDNGGSGNGSSSDIDDKNSSNSNQTEGEVDDKNRKGPNDNSDDDNGNSAIPQSLVELMYVSAAAVGGLIAVAIGVVVAVGICLRRRKKELCDAVLV